MNEEENIQIDEVKLDNNEIKPAKKKNKKLLIISLIVVLLAACSIGVGVYLLNKKDEPDGNKGKTNTSSNTNITKSEYTLKNNGLQKLDLAFLKLENKEENKVYSPLSIKYTLEMLAEASKGETKDQLDAIIGDYVAKKYENNDNMSFANMMFIRDSFKDSVNKEYQNKILSKYNGEVIYDAFANATNINKMISDKTFNLIDKIVEDKDVKENDFYLVNALAIDMYWNYKIQAAAGDDVPSKLYWVEYAHESVNGKPYEEIIDPIATESDYTSLTFNDNITAKAVKFASSINNYDIIKELGEDKIKATIIEAYKEEYPNVTDEDANSVAKKFVEELAKNYHKLEVSTDYRMYVDDNVKVFAKELQPSNNTTLEYIGIMPKEESLKSYIDKVTVEDLNKIIGNLKEIKTENFEEGKAYKIEGTIPLFNFTYQLDFKEDLEKVGVTNIFDETKADLSNLSKDAKVISDVASKATIEFSNEGIKAAATTEGGGWGNAKGWDYYFDIPLETIDLTFDKPYMFLIRDKDTGEIWFTGTVYTPIEK